MKIVVFLFLASFALTVTFWQCTKERNSDRNRRVNIDQASRTAGTVNDSAGVGKGIDTATHNNGPDSTHYGADTSRHN